MVATMRWRSYLVAGASLLFLLPLARLSKAEFIEASHFKKEAGPERRVVHAKRTAAAPKIDGVLDEPWWEEAIVSPNFVYGASRP
ncbi:unnamed protein product, partial [marine sediment metagenome]